MRASLQLVCSAVLVLMASAGPVRAEETVELPFPDSAGPELWIDGPLGVQVGGTKDFVDVAVDNSGRRVHVWGVTLVNGRDILMRRWTPLGEPLDPGSLVNTTTADLQDNPRVAVSTDGSFLVIWDSREPVANQGGALRILVRGRAYSANGNPAGTEQLLTSTPSTSLFPSDADVAALRTSDGSPGGYAAVWRSNGPTGTTIEGCLVSSNGVPGAQFQVNSDNTPGHSFPSVTELNDGGFLVVWSQTTGEVWGRRFNSAGGPIGNDFKISTQYATGTFETDTGIGWEGSVAVVWTDRDELQPAGDEQEIRARLFDSDLGALGPDFRVNTLIDQDQRWPRVADYGPAGFLVAWQSEVTSGDDLGDSVEARLVTGPSQFDGPQVQLNLSDNNNAQDRPGLHGWYGRATANWVSPVLDGEPPNNVGFLIGRDVDHCLFCDDLEWFRPGGVEGLWRWAVVVGAAP